MSTLVYAMITSKRETAGLRMSTETQPPGMTTFVDALAALIPGEVLAAHVAILALTTESSETPDGQSATIITNVWGLKVTFWALLAASLFLYVIGQYAVGRLRNWRLSDCARMLIPPLAFALWTMAQTPSAFDVVAPSWLVGARYVVAIIGALFVGGIALALGIKADRNPSS